jgi:DNA phosphorothioation-associated DGQHR protein 1
MYPIKAPAIRIMQPLGEFYAVSLPAKFLLETSYSEPLRVEFSEKSAVGFDLIGGQREKREVRLRQIGQFINTVEAAFPNSIILGANYRENGTLEEEESTRWTVGKARGGTGLELVIPTNAKLARIIDGQHRLDGFQFANPERLDMSMLCAVFLDLPLPYQAYLFATINFNQKKVDRSLAYQLFAFNVEEEPPECWSPDKLAVFLSRKLSVDEASPLRGHIVVAAQNDEVLLDLSQDNDWKVSTATIVDGILRLFSAKPQADRDLMHQRGLQEGRNRNILADDGTPFRGLYLTTNDVAIYAGVLNFFKAVQKTLWERTNERSYIRKTVGIQALFDTMRTILKDFKRQKNISQSFFEEYLALSSTVDFSDRFFQASGIGRTRIAKVLQVRAKLTEVSPDSPDLSEYRRLCEL